MDAETLIELYLRGASTDEVVGPAKPRRRSLKQKQGARNGGRTRTRRPYAEASKLDQVNTIISDAGGKKEAEKDGWLQYSVPGGSILLSASKKLKKLGVEVKVMSGQEELWVKVSSLSEADPGYSHGWLHYYYYHRRGDGRPPKA